MFQNNFCCEAVLDTYLHMTTKYHTWEKHGVKN